jgi:hypothetical protein
MEFPESPNSINDLESQFENQQFGENDLEDFINEFQRILQESPPGWQAKFARAIYNLKAQKNLVKSNSKDAKTPDNRELFSRIMKKIENELESTQFDRQKYHDLLTLAKLRELISNQKQRYDIK